jgi:hypothetical protein
MPAYPAAARRFPVNLAFNALLFSFLGWLILEHWNLDAHTGAVPHLLNTLACAPIMACSLHHYYRACPRHLRTSTRRPGARPAGRAALATLFAVGALFGLAAGGGSMTLIVLMAAACCFTPWLRMRAHQQHLFLSLLAVGAGAAAVAAVAAAALALHPGLPGREPSLMAVLPAASCLWGAAAALCIGLCGGELLKKKRH